MQVRTNHASAPVLYKRNSHPKRERGSRLLMPDLAFGPAHVRLRLAED